MNYVTNDPRNSGRRRNHLYDEFAAYYASERCRWAPNDPRRVFNLALKSIYPSYNRRLTAEQFLALIYDTLGVRQGRPRGLFQSFNPGKYKGRLSLQDHFVNLFMRRLKDRLKGNLSRNGTDQNRQADASEFQARPELGLYKVTRTSRWNRQRVESLPEALAFLLTHDREVENAVAEALAGLGLQEEQVIRLTYWGGLSRRKIGRLLGLDHKTVARRYDDALWKLREFYGVEQRVAA
jgi:RNA polymerase sigma factor (sigma-70 family)